MKRIFEALNALMEKGEDAMLVTLIAHSGSVPRGTGSMMLLGGGGRMEGSIGGGPGEMEMTELGMRLLGEKRCGQRQYVLRNRPGEEDGAVCGGEITVYFQFIAGGDPAWRSVCAQGLACMNERKRGWLALSLDGGAPWLLYGEEKAGCCMPEEAAELCRAGCVRTKTRFALPVQIGERAVIFGAGHCAQALAPVLASVGFCVTVYDDRPQAAVAERFAQAERVICAPYDQIEAHLTLDTEDYIVVMTSNHSGDLCIQEQVLRADHAYVGMLGSRNKRTFVYKKLMEAGIEQAMIDRIHTPVGLNICAVTPEEIAISIAAEMILERAKRRAC
ncbi:MAG: XdhC family protein [Clostridia bacterium]|nr:XdhC family protein [Clostridia bacterium]